jgi:quercetin dioxygenase-like cupin family protein
MSKYFVHRPDCSRHTIFPGVNIFTTAGQNMMLSVVELEPHAVVEPHQHPHEQMGVLLEGELTFTIGDEQRTLKPGDMWKIPGHVVHSAVAGEMKTVAIDVFNPIREDYL